MRKIKLNYFINKNFIKAKMLNILEAAEVDRGGNEEENLMAVLSFFFTRGEEAQSDFIGERPRVEDLEIFIITETHGAVNINFMLTANGFKTVEIYALNAAMEGE